MTLGNPRGKKILVAADGVGRSSVPLVISFAFVKETRSSWPNLVISRPQVMGYGPRSTLLFPGVPGRPWRSGLSPCRAIAADCSLSLDAFHVPPGSCLVP